MKPESNVKQQLDCMKYCIKAFDVVQKSIEVEKREKGEL